MRAQRAQMAFGHRRCSALAHSLFFACLSSVAWGSVGCVERNLNPEGFVCRRGGPCPDASDPGAEDSGFEPLPDAGVADSGGVPDGGARDAGRPDGGLRDGGLRDGGAPDSGQPPPCANTYPMPLAGFLQSDLTGQADNTESACNPGSGAPDQVFSLEVPVPLRSLRFRTEPGTAFDSVIEVFRDACTRGTELACNDNGPDFFFFSEVVLTDVTPGTYYVAVDSLAPGTTGRYFLEVEGTVNLGDTCTPDIPFIVCEKGTFCGESGGTSTCQPIKDCPDGIDNDGDGETDEDAAQCATPPIVTCGAVPTLMDPYYLFWILNMVSTPRTLAGYNWEVIEQPSQAAGAYLWTDHSLHTFFFAPTVGRYRQRFTAFDDQGYAASCETESFSPPTSNLYVEMIWHGEKARVDLHMLSPRATHWYDPGEDCFDPACRQSLPWGAADAADNPTTYGIFWTPGPWTLRVPTPEIDPRGYRIGVQADRALGPLSTTVRIHCNGALAQEIGPVTLMPGIGDVADLDKPFWKVADVVFTDAGCTVTPLLDAQNQPLTVTKSEAMSAR